MKTKGIIILCLGFLLFSILPLAQAGTQSKGRACLASKDLGGDPAPTFWSPWMPPAYAGVRYKVGIIPALGQGSVNIRVPIMVGVNFDDAMAVQGNYFPVDVGLSGTQEYNYGDNAKNLVADFGLSFPDKLEVGLGAGVSDVVSVGSWWTMPGGYGLWDLIALIPEVGSTIVSGTQVLGVNVREAFVPPLGGIENTYGQPRDLLNISLADMVTGSATDGSSNLGKLVNKLYTKVQWLKPALISADTAKGLIGTGLSKALGMINFRFVGRPEYKWKGNSVICDFRAEFDGLPGASQDFSVTFNGAGQTKTFRVYVPWNVTPSNKLNIYMTGAKYNMKLSRKLTLDLSFTCLNWSPSFSNNVVFNGDVIDTNIDSAHWKICDQIPIQPATGAFNGVTPLTGCQSIRFSWHSPSLLTKGKMEVFAGGVSRGVASEPYSATDHTLLVTGLTTNTDYVVRLSATDDAGQVYNYASDFTMKTATQCVTRSTESWGIVGSNLRVESITRNSAVIRWDTNVNCSTEVIYAPTPDYGTVGRWEQQISGGNKIQGVQHYQPLFNLEAGTTYYFSAVSWTYIDRVNTDKWEKSMESFTTLPPPPPPSCRVKVRKLDNTVLAGVPVTIEKNAVGVMVVLTGADGYTPYVVLDYDAAYALNADMQCHDLQNNTKPGFTIPPAAQVSDVQRPNYINMTKEIIAVPKQSIGGFVLDARTQGAVVGATVSIPSKGVTASTNAAGNFIFSGLPAGEYPATITKSGFFDSAINPTVDDCGVFRAGVTYLRAKSALVTIHVNKGTGGVASAAYASCPVTVKEGTSTITPTLTTDGSGTATWSPALDFADDNPHTLKISATPAGGSAYLAVEQELVIANGQNADIVLLCPQKDTSAPVAAGLTLQRSGMFVVQAIFNTDKLAKGTLKMIAKGAVIGQKTETDFGLVHNIVVTLQSPLPSGLTLNVYDAPATIVELTLADTGGNSATTTHPMPSANSAPSGSNITINKVNADPDAIEPTEAVTGESIFIYAQGSDLDGFVASQVWEITGEPIRTINKSNNGEARLLTQPGNMHIKVTFTDNEGLIFVAEKDLNVTEAPPTVVITGPIDPLVRPDEELTLSVEAASFVGLEEITVNWGDGSPAQVITLTGDKIKVQVLKHTYTNAGKFNFTAQAKSTTTIQSLVAAKELTIFKRPKCSLSIAGAQPFESGQEITLNFTAEATEGFEWKILRGINQIAGGTSTKDTLSSSQKVSVTGNVETFILRVTDPAQVSAEAVAIALVGGRFRAPENAGAILEPRLSVAPQTVVVGGRVTANVELIRRALPSENVRDVGVLSRGEVGEAVKSADVQVSRDQARQQAQENAGNRINTGNTMDIGASVRQQQFGRMIDKAKSQRGGATQSFDQIWIDWGDGAQEVVSLDENTSPLHHTYGSRPESGTYTVNAMLRDITSSSWAATNSIEVTVGLPLPSVLPDAIVTGGVVTAGGAVTDIPKPPEIVTAEAREEKKEELREGKMPDMLADRERQRALEGRQLRSTKAAGRVVSLESTVAAPLTRAGTTAEETREISKRPASIQKEIRESPPDMAPVNIVLIDANIPLSVTVGERSTIEVNVKNESDVDIRSATVSVKSEDGLNERQRVSLAAKAREKVRFTWTPKREGRQELVFSLECKEDTNPRDNVLTAKVDVKGKRTEERAGAQPQGERGAADQGLDMRSGEKDKGGRLSGILKEAGELERR